MFKGMNLPLSGWQVWRWALRDGSFLCFYQTPRWLPKAQVVSQTKRIGDMQAWEIGFHMSSVIHMRRVGYQHLQAAMLGGYAK